MTLSFVEVVGEKFPRQLRSYLPMQIIKQARLLPSHPRPDGRQPCKFLHPHSRCSHLFLNRRHRPNGRQPRALHHPHSQWYRRCSSQAFRLPPRLAGSLRRSPLLLKRLHFLIGSQRCLLGRAIHRCRRRGMLDRRSLEHCRLAQSHSHICHNKRTRRHPGLVIQVPCPNLDSFYNRRLMLSSNGLFVPSNLHWPRMLFSVSRLVCLPRS